MVDRVAVEQVANSVGASSTFDSLAAGFCIKGADQWKKNSTKFHEVDFEQFPFTSHNWG
jgi:hypothetical protein